MSKNVFANGREISGKASGNRSIAALPDVCLSPPGPPAGPLPIPYPNTALAKHTSGGSRSVKLGRQEVGKKNRSKYSKSTGNQPATRNFGMGVISHNLTGPAKFAAWSMDVKVEGANVTRFLDLTTHNHTNCGNGGIQASMGNKGAIYKEENCVELAAKNEAARKEMQDGATQRQKELRSKREKPKAPKKSKADPSQGDGPPAKKQKLESQEQATQRTDALEQAENQAIADCTITHALHTLNGVTTPMKACSNALLMRYGNGFVQGLGPKKALGKLDAARKKWLDEKTAPTKSGGKGKYHNSLACFGTEDDDRVPFRYSNPAQCTPAYASHTEARLLDEIYKTVKGGGGSLLLCVDWPNGEQVKTRRSACDASCQKLICAALACIDIEMCDENDQPKKPNCPGKGGGGAAHAH